MAGSKNILIFVAVGVIWIVVLLTSFNSPELIFGDAPVIIKVSALTNWFWGLLGTLFLIRLTIFRRTDEIGWGEDTAYPWIAVSVSALWVIAAFITFRIPDVVVSDSIIIPAGAILAPPTAAALTYVVTEFLVSGFAARNAGGTVQY